MGHDVKLKTDHIYKGYLTLGLLEMARDEDEGRPIPQIDLINHLDPTGEKDKSEVRRKYLARAKGWLKEADVPEDEIKKLISADHSGFKLTGYISPSSYEDFIGSLLHLYLIYTKQHKESIKDLVNIENRTEKEKPLSVITKLILAQENKKGVKIKYLNNDGETTEVTVRNHKLKLNNNRWLLEGINAANCFQVSFPLTAIIKITNFQIIL